MNLEDAAIEETKKYTTLSPWAEAVMDARIKRITHAIRRKNPDRFMKKVEIVIIDANDYPSIWS